MNSAPSSTGIRSPGMCRVQQRPPTRSRASTTRTRQPARASASAAARPAAPAPTTMTSASMPSLHFHMGIGGDLAPELDLLLDLGEELLGRAAGRRDAVVLQRLGGFLQRERLGDLRVQAIDDRPRQAL